MTGTSSSISRSQVRKFGTIAFPLFGTVFLVRSLVTHQWRPHLFGVIAIFGLLCLLMPGPMTPLYRGWMYIGSTVVKAFSTIMLASAFYLLFTPYAVLTRLFRGRSLPSGPDRSLDSYWLTRPVPAQSKEQFFKRY
jgi:hypothetical protein